MPNRHDCAVQALIAPRRQKPAQECFTSNRVSLGCTVMMRACSSSSWDSDRSRQAKNLVEAMKLGSSEDLQAQVQGGRC